MLKKLTTLTVAAVGLAVITLLFLGPRYCFDLVTTQRERIKEQTASLVDPAVEFNSAVQAAERTLPRQIADLKIAMQDAEKELTSQAHALVELRDVLLLVETDLQVLAPVVVNGDAEACELHGERYTVAQAKEVAQRLLAKKRYYTEMLSAREKLIARLREQRSKMQEQLVRAEAAVADFAENAREIKAKIALVKASQKAEALQRTVGSDGMADSGDSFAQLERRLDSALAEMNERAKLRESVVADSYVGKVREESMIEELARYVPEISREDGSK